MFYRFLDVDLFSQSSKNSTANIICPGYNMTEKTRRKNETAFIFQGVFVAEQVNGGGCPST